MSDMSKADTIVTTTHTESTRIRQRQRLAQPSDGIPSENPAQPIRAALMITCVGDVLAPEVVEATVRVVRAAGCWVSCDLSQTCCGQPAWNAGFAEQAATVARPTLQALAAELDRGAEVIVVPAGSCATMIRLFWAELFEIVGDHEAAAQARRVAERTREVSELLGADPGLLGDMALDPGEQFGRDAHTIRVALHHSCHLLRELHVSRQPVDLLDAIDGVELVEWDGSDRCCGFGGTFSVKLPEASVAMADDKLRTLRACQPDMVVGCDTSCLLHLRTRAEALGTPVRVRHVAEVVSDALGLSPDPEGGQASGPRPEPQP